MPLTLQEAQIVIAGAHERAAKIGALVTLAVVNEGGHLQALGRMSGAAPLSARIAETKAASVALFRRDGAALRQLQEAQRWLLRPAGPGRAGAHPGGRRRGANPAGGHRPGRDVGKRRNGARARRRMRRSRACCSRSLGHGHGLDHHRALGGVEFGGLRHPAGVRTSMALGTVEGGSEQIGLVPPGAQTPNVKAPAGWVNARA